MTEKNPEVMTGARPDADAKLAAAIGGAGHTPGPWRFCRAWSGEDVLVTDASGDRLAMVRGKDVVASIAAANANLIAAAPDLLAACEAARAIIMQNAAPQGLALLVMRQMNAALARAKGGAA